MSVLKPENKKNITHLNNYSINKTLENIRQQKRKKFVRVRTGIILVTGLVLIGMTGLPLIDNMNKTEEYNQQHAAAASELARLETEKEQLEYKVALLEDEEYIAKLARQELNLSKPNEILINLPEEEASESDEGEETNNNEEENESQ